jgi:hypothetical protein
MMKNYRGIEIGKVATMGAAQVRVIELRRVPGGVAADSV